MHKRIIFLILIISICGLFSYSYKALSTPVNNTETVEEIFFADPTIFHNGDGNFYLTGTRAGYPLGFVMLESNDLTNWKEIKPDSMVLKAGESSYGNQWFWAPQILQTDSNYLFAYTANEQTAVAESKDLKGPYSQNVIKPIDDSEKNIDPFLFRDDDGRWYLYHVRFNRGNYLWVAEFDPTTSQIKKETLTKCFINTQPWETSPVYDSDPIMEGPTVIKLENKYYLFYSANHFESPDYAVGYAVADSPMGPWMKYPYNPIISRHIVGENGSGHGDIFKDTNGNLRYVYHVHYSDSVVAPRRTRILTLKLEKDSLTGIYNISVDKNSIIKINRKK